MEVQVRVTLGVDETAKNMSILDMRRVISAFEDEIVRRQHIALTVSETTHMMFGRRLEAIRSVHERCGISLMAARDVVNSYKF